MKRDFDLIESDVLFLNSLGLQWQAQIEVRCQWVILNKYPIPIGYNVREANVALLIPPGYPTAQIDMVYFFPHLSKLDKRTIGALAMRTINGIQYQRWSRHRTAVNPWRPGIDDISTHLQLVDNWLDRELKK